MSRKADARARIASQSTVPIAVKRRVMVAISLAESGFERAVQAMDDGAEGAVESEVLLFAPSEAQITGNSEAVVAVMVSPDPVKNSEAMVIVNAIMGDDGLRAHVLDAIHGNGGCSFCPMGLEDALPGLPSGGSETPN